MVKVNNDFDVLISLMKLPKIFKTVISIIFSFLDQFLVFNLKANRSNKEIYNLLVKVDAIGDFIIWIPFARVICKNFDEKFILVCRSDVKLLALKLNLFDQVIGINIKKFRENLNYRINVLRYIKSLKLNYAIQTTYSRDFLSGDCLIRAANAIKKIGSKGDTTNQSSFLKNFSDSWYDYLVYSETISISEFDRNKNFIDYLCKSNYSLKNYIPKLTDFKIQSFTNDPYIVFFPGASNKKRIWPIENFSLLAKNIIDKYSYKIILCGSSSEVNICNLINKGVNDSNIIDLSGQTSLEELIEIIRGSKFLLGNESSGVHIAAALEVPSVCILGGGHFGRFMPYPDWEFFNKPIAVFEKLECYNCNWKCTVNHNEQDAYPCVENIKLRKIFFEVDKILSKLN